MCACTSRTGPSFKIIILQKEIILKWKENPSLQFFLQGNRKSWKLQLCPTVPHRCVPGREGAPLPLLTYNRDGHFSSAVPRGSDPSLVPECDLLVKPCVLPRPVGRPGCVPCPAVPAGRVSVLPWPPSSSEGLERRRCGMWSTALGRWSPWPMGKEDTLGPGHPFCRCGRHYLESKGNMLALMQWLSRETLNIPSVQALPLDRHSLLPVTFITDDCQMLPFSIDIITGFSVLIECQHLTAFEPSFYNDYSWRSF